uniref:Ig-like domain-containing protein n=1 Tax=Denticeps clupeoides TaxID=299321 RepID=A0AAY3ZYY8_9TELE
MSFLAFLSALIIVQGIWGKESKVIGFLGRSITLSSGKNANWTLTRVLWSIYQNSTYIAKFQDGKIDTEKIQKYVGRLKLDIITGDLEISGLREGDDITYTVLLMNSEDKQETHKLSLTLRAPISPPSAEQTFSVFQDGSCFTQLKCSSAERATNFSWVLRGTSHGQHWTSTPNSTESILFTSLQKNTEVTFTCIISNGFSTSSRNITAVCQGMKAPVYHKCNCRSRPGIVSCLVIMCFLLVLGCYIGKDIFSATLVLSTIV